MGLVVSVFKNPLGDATNNGMSSKFSQLCLVNVEGPSQPREGCPPALLVLGRFPGLVYIVPAFYAEIGKYLPVPGWSMMGGNYAATSDSRFHEAVRRLIGGESYGAVPIHDRFE